jgi:hypothetical protein
MPVSITYGHFKKGGHFTFKKKQRDTSISFFFHRGMGQVLLGITIKKKKFQKKERQVDLKPCNTLGHGHYWNQACLGSTLHGSSFR